MSIIYRQNQLFTFLLYCNSVGAEKTILDCGAGGMLPPLGIFKDQGYETKGIDNSEKALNFAKQFEEEKGYDLGIQHGDMKKMDFEDESFGFSYSYNTIFHMSKKEIKTALGEMKRVTQHGGLIFVNFVSSQDERCGMGECVGQGEYLELEHGEQVLHSYFEESEAETFFEALDLKVIYKEVRKRKGPKRGGGFVTLGYIDYIVEK